MGFEEVFLEDITDFRNGRAIDKIGRGEFPVYGSNGIIGYTDNYEFENGIIIGRVGAYCGSVFYEKDRFWATDNTIVAQPKEDVNIRFLCYLLVNLKLNNYAGGAAQPLLTQSRVRKIRVRIPSKRIQDRIACILAHFDELVEVNLRRIKILEEISQSLYNEWFVKLNYPGHENAEIVETSQGSMPKEWQIQNLGDICTIIMGQSPSSKYYNEDGKGLPFHQGVSDFGEIFPITKRYSTKGNRIAEHGDILFSVRAPVGRINFANTRMILGRGLCGIRSKTGDQMFLYVQLKRIFYEEDIMGGGTIFKAVTKKDMHNIKVIYPTRALVDEFEGFSKPIFDQIEILSNKNRILRRMKNLILPKLFSDEFELDTLDIDTSSD